MSDALASGRRRRVMGVHDLFTREALVIQFDVLFPGTRVVPVLERLAASRGVPAELVARTGQRPPADRPVPSTPWRRDAEGSR